MSADRAAPRRSSSRAKAPAPAEPARTPSPAPSTAPAPAERATVRFTAEPSCVISGTLVPGGQLAIEYEPARVQALTGTALVPEQMTAHVRFSPGGQSEEQSALSLVATGGASARLAQPRPLVVDVPREATEAEVWFALRCEGRDYWDSNYGNNFHFSVNR